jgi:hypothetical protein
MFLPVCGSPPAVPAQSAASSLTYSQKSGKCYIAATAHTRTHVSGYQSRSVAAAQPRPNGGPRARQRRNCGGKLRAEVIGALGPPATARLAVAPGVRRARYARARSARPHGGGPRGLPRCERARAAARPAGQTREAGAKRTRWSRERCSQEQRVRAGRRGASSAHWAKRRGRPRLTAPAGPPRPPAPPAPRARRRRPPRRSWPAPAAPPRPCRLPPRWAAAAG